MAVETHRQAGMGGLAWTAVTVIVSLGMVVLTWFLLSGFLLQRGDVARLDAPGDIEAPLEQGIVYAIFHEYSRADDSVGFIKPLGQDDLRIQIQRAGGGPLVPLADYTDETYGLRRRYAESMHRFTVPESGGYRVVALFASEDPPEPITLVIRPSSRALARAAYLRAGATLLVSTLLVLLVVRVGLRPERP